jgi:hypothetical protein
MEGPTARDILRAWVRSDYLPAIPSVPERLTESLADRYRVERRPDGEPVLLGRGGTALDPGEIGRSDFSSAPPIGATLARYPLAP